MSVQCIYLEYRKALVVAVRVSMYVWKLPMQKATATLFIRFARTALAFGARQRWSNTERGRAKQRETDRTFGQKG